MGQFFSKVNVDFQLSVTLQSVFGVIFLLQTWTSVPLRPITVMVMPTVQTQKVDSFAAVLMAMHGMDLIALVINDQLKITDVRFSALEIDEA